jgi:hypothetical protein
MSRCHIIGVEAELEPESSGLVLRNLLGITDSERMASVDFCLRLTILDAFPLLKVQITTTEFYSVNSTEGAIHFIRMGLNNQPALTSISHPRTPHLPHLLPCHRLRAVFGQVLPQRNQTLVKQICQRRDAVTAES